MTRISKIDACLICGETPCDCKRRLAKSGTPKTVQQSHGPMEKPAKLDIPEFRPKYIPKTRVKSAHSLQVSSQQLILIAALRNVEPLMSPESREQFQSLLMTEETYEERVAFWRARRDVQKEV